MFNLACYTEQHTCEVATTNYNRGNYDQLRALLREVDWARMHDMDVHNAYQFFRSSLKEAVDSSVPKTRRRSRKNLYINSKALKLKRKKNSLWGVYMKSGDPIDFA